MFSGCGSVSGRALLLPRPLIAAGEHPPGGPGTGLLLLLHRQWRRRLSARLVAEQIFPTSLGLDYQYNVLTFDPDRGGGDIVLVKRPAVAAPPQI